MGKEKFYYNKQTLQYEKVVLSLRAKILRGIGAFTAVMVPACLIGIALFKYAPSPEKDALHREIKQMETQYLAMSGQLDMMSKVLENVQERDAGVHRMMFGMEPLDASLWNGGVGGSEKYDYLTRFKNSGDLLIATQEKADKLKRQLAVQSQSLDKIEEMAKGKEEMLASIPAIKPIDESKLKRKIKALSGFGMRLHPVHKIRKMHAGIDFTAAKGTPIRATGNGKIIKVSKLRTGYGTHVVIDHGYGYQTLYGHMNTVDVKKGQKVTRGQVIGTVGNTGTSTAPHLHYEVHQNNKKVNPIHYCMDGLTPEEYKQLADMASTSNQSFD